VVTNGKQLFLGKQVVAQNVPKRGESD
jgi:hypothetical protein